MNIPYKIPGKEGFIKKILDIIDGDIVFEQSYNIEIFNDFYKINTLNGDWKERSFDEKFFLADTYVICKFNGEVIGGFHISYNQRNFDCRLYLQCLYVCNKGKGYGRKIISKIEKDLSPGIILTYSKVGEFFEKVGFEKCDGYFSETGSSLYIKKI